MTQGVFICTAPFIHKAVQSKGKKVLHKNESLFIFCHSQSTLLQQLGVAPFSEGPWPLYIHPQSLSVLSRLLLIWQHKASVQGEPDVPECMKVWERYFKRDNCSPVYVLWTCLNCLLMLSLVTFCISETGVQSLTNNSLAVICWFWGVKYIWWLALSEKCLLSICKVADWSIWVHIGISANINTDSDVCESLLSASQYISGTLVLLLSLFCLIFALPSCSYRFLGTLKQHTIQSSVHGDDDLNVEHLQLLLLLFHNLSERGRRSVLTLVTQAITEVAQSRDSQLKAVPLNLARLCLVFDYLLRHYSKAPLYLFEQVSGCSSEYFEVSLYCD